MDGPSFFEIQVEDINRARLFYGEVFDWAFIKAEGLPVEYWRIKTASTWGGLMKRPTDAPAPMRGTNAFVCSIRVEDFDSVEERIVAMGGEVALPKFAVPGACWQGYFLDTEGNTFGIFQVDEEAA